MHLEQMQDDWEIARWQAREQQEFAREQLEEQRQIAQQVLEEQREIAHEQLENQREIAHEQLENQREIAREEKLNEFKLRLLNFSIQAISEPEKATAAALIMIRSTTFSDNIHWFWGDLIRNNFLIDVYFKEALAPLLTENEPITYLDDFDHQVLIDADTYLDKFDHQVLIDAEVWLQRFTNESDWGRVVLPKIIHYKKIIRQREDEAEKKILVQKAKQAAKLLERQAQQAALHERNRIINIRNDRRKWIIASIVTLNYSVVYLIAGWKSYRYLLTWLTTGNGLGPGFGPLAVGTTVMLFLAVLLATLRKIHTFTASTIRNGVDPFGAVFWLSATATTGIVLNYWALANDTRIQVAMLASVIILPMIPLVRELLTVALISAVTGLISFSIACLGGFSTGHLINWISTDQPTEHTKKLEENPTNSDTPKSKYAQKLGREATIDDKDGWSNLRKNPSLSSPVIRRIRQAETFYVIETNDDWCKVLTESSEEGWMHRSIIKITTSP